MREPYLKRFCTVCVIIPINYCVLELFHSTQFHFVFLLFARFFENFSLELEGGIPLQWCSGTEFSKLDRQDLWYLPSSETRSLTPSNHPMITETTILFLDLNVLNVFEQTFVFFIVTCWTRFQTGCLQSTSQLLPQLILFSWKFFFLYLI